MFHLWDLFCLVMFQQLDHHADHIVRRRSLPARVHKLLREGRIEKIVPQIVGGKSKYLCTYDADPKGLGDYTLERNDSSFGVNLIITEAKKPEA